jgi:DNA topoisomerase 2-associated protein PAT1
MISSQSPRFHEHQRQLLILQQQKEQQQRLQDLQDQARFEELERRMAAVNMERTRGSDPVFNDRHTPNFSVAELQEAQRLQLLQQAAQERQFLLQQQQQQQQQQYRRQGSRSPAVPNKAQYAAALREAMPQFQNQNVQLQQRLLADLAHGDFPRDIGGSHAEQEALRLEAMRKILEAEKMEEKRRRKAAKIAHMVCSVYIPSFQFGTQIASSFSCRLGIMI